MPENKSQEDIARVSKPFEVDDKAQAEQLAKDLPKTEAALAELGASSKILEEQDHSMELAAQPDAKLAKDVTLALIRADTDLQKLFTEELRFEVSSHVGNKALAQLEKIVTERGLDIERVAKLGAIGAVAMSYQEVINAIGLSETLKIKLDPDGTNNLQIADALTLSVSQDPNDPSKYLGRFTLKPSDGHKLDANLSIQGDDLNGQLAYGTSEYSAALQKQQTAIGGSIRLGEEGALSASAGVKVDPKKKIISGTGSLDVDKDFGLSGNFTDNREEDSQSGEGALHIRNIKLTGTGSNNRQTETTEGGASIKINDLTLKGSATVDKSQDKTTGYGSIMLDRTFTIDGKFDNKGAFRFNVEGTFEELHKVSASIEQNLNFSGEQDHRVNLSYDNQTAQAMASLGFDTDGNKLSASLRYSGLNAQLNCTDEDGCTGNVGWQMEGVRASVEFGKKSFAFRSTGDLRKLIGERFKWATSVSLEDKKIRASALVDAHIVEALRLSIAGDTTIENGELTDGKVQLKLVFDL